MTPTPPNQPMEVKIVGDKKERANHANRKALALLLKPASSTPSTTGSLRSFQRDTERGTNVAILRSPTTRRRERLPMSNQSSIRGTRAGTYGRGTATLKGCIGLLLILNNMHNSATDRRWARLHSKTPPARKPAFLTTLFSSLRCESAAEHHTAE